ncbi:hypothetical protein [Brucella tritici]|uniref:Uncharacterized protein n=1 Tax=Brucella tritici TaxID=94626 RepID=A0A6L3YN36_9HYPH|nr:hypothetical protein [Brucella tritici]KAB2684332.1 hypothetical protein F9L08_13620 [Brucella tritici]
MPAVIDVWNTGTFDSDLKKLLEANGRLIRAYFDTDNAIFLSYDLGRGHPRPTIRPDNQHASGFYSLLEEAGQLMAQRTIRAFHYTRLTDDEVADLSISGVHLSTPETLERRFNALVASSILSDAIADSLYAQSPFHSDQHDARTGKFWMTSHPTNPEDSGVAPLMKHWGGEVAWMWVNDPELLTPLQQIGTPRIIEIAIPLAATLHSYSAAKAVVAAFGRSLGAIPDKGTFDLYANQALPPSAVLAIHADRDPAFAAMGRTYPSGFVDVDLGRWKELTGEED